MFPMRPDPSWYQSHWMAQTPRPRLRHRAIELACLAVTSALAVAAIALLVFLPNHPV